MEYDQAEEWRTIPGYRGYEASNLGRIRSYWNNYGRLLTWPYRVLSTKPKGTGYVSVRVKKDDGGYIFTSAHRLVALAFLGPPPDRTSQVCHGNGIKNDNRIENLRYDTPIANMADVIRHGRSMRGEKNNTTKLQEELVVAIRYLYANKRANRRELARLFGVSYSQIGNILRGESWRHLWD